MLHFVFLEQNMWPIRHVLRQGDNAKPTANKAIISCARNAFDPLPPQPTPLPPSASSAFD